MGLQICWNCEKDFENEGLITHKDIDNITDIVYCPYCRAENIKEEK